MLNRDLMDIIKKTAPGTALRDGLDNIVRAGTGALIVINESSQVMDLVDGGFAIDSEFLPAYLYELAKMDGAIVLSKDFKHILRANALLVPHSTIPTSETGTKHKAAERTSRQTGALVISISQRRNIISIYHGTDKYMLRQTETILAHANNALQTMEKHKKALMRELDNLTALEFSDMVRISEVAVVLARAESTLRIADEIRICIYELGSEGRLVSIQLEELLSNIESEEYLILRDYIKDLGGIEVDHCLELIRQLDDDDLNNLDDLLKIMGYSGSPESIEYIVQPKGYRVLNRIPRLPGSIQLKLVKRFKNLPGILAATTEQLDDVDGIGEQRTRSISLGLKRMRIRVGVDD
jgi:diadenylate cyclase